MFDILAVCAANVCRSPSIQQLLLARLARDPWTRSLISVSSGGFTPPLSAAPCTKILRHELATADLAAFERGHLAREVTAAELDSASLILAASLSERAASVRLNVAARERTFTLIEAALLAEEVVESTPVPVKLTGGERLRWLAREMDVRRGSLAMAIPHQRRAWTRPWISQAFTDLDLPDPHATHAVTHNVLRKRMSEAIDSLARSLEVTLTQTGSVRVV